MNANPTATAQQPAPEGADWGKGSMTLLLVAVLALALGFMIGFDAGWTRGMRKVVDLLMSGDKVKTRVPCPGWLEWLFDVFGRRRWNELSTEVDDDPSAPTAHDLNRLLGLDDEDENERLQ